MGTKTNGPAVIPTRTLIALLLSMVPWMLTAVLWCGRWLTYGQWPTKHKEWIALGISIVLSAYFRFYGDSELRKGYWPIARRGVAVTGRQGVVVALVFLCLGVFGAWFVSM